MAEENAVYLRLVEEKALSKKKQLEEEKKKQVLEIVPYLPKDCISNILIRLPIESLHKSRFVCKPWDGIVSNQIFIDTHLRQSDNVIIFQNFYSARVMPQSSEKDERKTFSLETKLYDRQNVHVFNRNKIHSSFSLKYLEIKEGNIKIGDFNATCSGKMRTTCKGLILLDNVIKKGGLIVMNPVTKEFDPLPLGSLYPSHEESYGLGFSETTKEFKIVHLFRDEMQFVGCEILKLGKKWWIPIDGPSFGLFSWFGYDPVFAIGALHWYPEIDHCDYIVSMGMDDEKFVKILLPKNTRYNERIVDIGGFLGFVSHEDMNQIKIWILKDIQDGNWVKHRTIAIGCIADMVPIYCTRFNGELVFKDKDGTLLCFDFELNIMRRIKIQNGVFHGCFFPHVNSLVSWRNDAKHHDI